VFFFFALDSVAPLVGQGWIMEEEGRLTSYHDW
jgi:hypothetical protein